MKFGLKNKLMYLFVFLPICGLLWIGLHLDVQNTKSLRERRVLERYPKYALLRTHRLEKYISDHIPFRERLIDFYFKSKLGFDLGTNRFVIGKDNFIFLLMKNKFVLNGMKVYQNEVVLDDETINVLRKNIQTIAGFAKEHNIKVYFLMPPLPLRIYAHLVPDYILRKNNPSLFEQIEKAGSPDITFVPIEEKLIQKARKAKYPLVYKTDPHWTEDGAYEAYQLLMQAVAQDFKGVVPLKRQDFHIEYLNLVWNLYNAKPFREKGRAALPGFDHISVLYRHYIFKDVKKIKETLDAGYFRSSDYEKGQPYRVYLIGDSFSSYFLPFLKPTFQHVYFYRFNQNAKPYGLFWEKRKQELLKEKPDILILAISDQQVSALINNF